VLQQRVLQHSVMHTTAASVGQQDTHTGVPAHTHTCARTHTHARMRTCTHIRTQTSVCMHTGEHTQIHRHTRAHANIHTRACARTHTHSHTLTHTCICTRCARDGLRQFFSVASDAPSLRNKKGIELFQLTASGSNKTTDYSLISSL